MAEIGVTQQDVARQIRVSVTSLNLYLKGRRQAPSGFESRVLAALDLLERAEQAAEEARRRVLEEAAP